MDDKDNDLKNALDDIFGSDFIEIDTNNMPDDINKNDQISTDEINNKKQPLLNDTLITSTDSIVQNNSILSDGISYQSSMDSLIKNDQEREINNSLVPDESNVLNDNKKQSNFIDSIKTKPRQDGEKKEQKKYHIDNKKIFLYFIIGFVLGLILIFILVNYIFGITKVVNCSSSAEDTGYKFTDEYKITYKKNKITYLESIYTYTALNDEYKGQIEYVKEEKLPVVVNSNGMPGFTYLYETSDDYFKVSGYLDFTLIDFDKIDKMDQDLMPISYVKINTKIDYKTLKKDLEKQGYKCIPSK